jgi:hypothetical protein
VEAKVDIRKLQLLNDRIAQVTDALNQVRLSVHGLTHTGAIGQPGLGVPSGGLQQLPFGVPQATPYGLGQPIGFQHTPYYPGAVAGIPFGHTPWQGGQPSPFVGGFGSPGSPFGQLPWQGGQPSPFVGYGSSGIPFGQLPTWQTGVPSPIAGPFGLQHTGAYGPSPYGIPSAGLQGMGGGWPGGSPSFAIGGAGGAGLYQGPEPIEHRLMEQRASDPNSILQTFPFCQAPVSQVTW